MNQPPISFENQSGFYSGKVRDVYYFGEKMAVVVSDRISAFDHILPREIPYKGQVLNQLAAHFLDASRDIIPNWLEIAPHPNVSIGDTCQPIKLEMVVRGYLAGHAWRTYKSGGRELCGIKLPDGMKEGDAFPEPIITPATKAEEGHDEDISKEEILDKVLLSEQIWNQLAGASQKLFELGTKMAAERGLILVDTKYEFGLRDGKVILIDEIHTPDSSRYYIKEGYEERQAKGEHQKQLSKEFVREWLMENGFQGLEGQSMPDIPDDFVKLVSDRYINLYEILTGRNFIRGSYENRNVHIRQSIENYFSK